MNKCLDNVSNIKYTGISQHKIDVATNEQTLYIFQFLRHWRGVVSAEIVRVFLFVGWK